MNKIRFSANPDTNYVFHMLSVAGCGYDNAYGARYAPLYPPEDLAVFKQHEQLITVCGGQHLGALYGIFVCDAACADFPASEYYAGLMRRADIGDLPDSLLQHSHTLSQLSAVMLRHYDHYVQDIWPKDQAIIAQYIPQVQTLFEQTSFTEKAEEAVGISLSHEFFTAGLVASVENGAEAIDISDDQDVFGIERSAMDALYFIGHEFIIYLLFDALRNENAFHDHNTWNITEGLAEYYLKQILGDTRFFHAQEAYAAFFEQLSSQSSLTAAELYRKALEHFSDTIV